MMHIMISHRRIFSQRCKEMVMLLRWMHVMMITLIMIHVMRKMMWVLMHLCILPAIGNRTSGGNYPLRFGCV